MKTDRFAKCAQTGPILIAGIVLSWALVGCPSALAGEKVSGRALFLVTPATTIPVGSTEDDHVLRYAAERGTQMEYTGTEWLKDCALLRTGTCDLVRGRGSCYGYQIWVAPSGDRLVAKYSGVMLPESNADKKPADTIFRGTWVYVKGSGIFATVSGAGVYRGRYKTPTEYELAWSGELDRNVTIVPAGTGSEER